MIKSENYLVVQGWMISELGLSGNELMCYALIYGFSQDGESVFQGNSRYISEWLNISQCSVFTLLKKLTEKGLIEKIEKTINGVKLCDYKINLEVLKNLNGGIKKLYRGTKESLEGGTKETLDNNNIKDNIKNNKEKNKDKSLSKKAQEGFVFPDDKEAKFLEWCNTHIPNVMRNKKPLSYAEYIQLQCDGFIPQKILDKLLYINAIAGFNRKYHDVYGVLKNWLNGDNDPNYYQKFKNKKDKDKVA